MRIAGPDQGQPAELRHGTTQPLPGERAAQIGAERQALADGVDPGFLARMGDHGRDIAGREDARIARRAQSSSVATKPPDVKGSPVSPSHRAAPASVTHRASSKPIRRPSARISCQVRRE